MADRFPACLAMVLASEGGFTDTLGDGPAATNYGITADTLADWLGHPVSIADVRGLTRETAAAIYRARYWAATHCDDLPAGVDLMVFDQAVNMGTGTAARALQAAVGVKADGIIGPATLAAVRASDARQMIERIAELREAQSRALPTFGHFGTGWLARLARTKAAALAMVKT